MESDNIRNMSLRLMSAISGSVENKDDLARKKQEGDQALEALLTAVQSCQTKYGGRSELATEDDIRIQDLCERWTNVLSHGIRTSQSSNQTSLQSIVSAGINFALNINSIGIAVWNYTLLHLTNHEQQRFKYLKNVNTPIGYFRAFLRSALNERSLERYLHSWINHRSMNDFYEDWALMKNTEATNILPNMAAGLLSILFALSIDKSELNESQASEKTVQIEPIIALKPPSAKVGVKKNALRQVISFDSNEETNDKKTPKTSNDKSITVQKNDNIKNNWSSAPSTCINSPDPGSKYTTIETQSEPTTSNYDAKKLQFFPDGSCEKYLESPGQILARLSERAKDIFSSKKSLTGDSNSQKDSDVSSSKHLSESESEGVPTEGSVSCLELCFPEDDNLIDGSENDLHALLEKQRTENLSLQLKMTHLEMAHKEKILKMERMILDLNRENDRLKEQLKKYISAVQMLKQDESQSDEIKQYESKLIQVAEMHAELMEFNEVLQRRLEAANTPVVASYSSGALTSEYTTFDDGNVHIWVPSAFLISNGSKSFHVYQVFIKIKTEEWNVYRRYSEFRKLFFDLKNSHPDVATFKFPPKKTIGKKEAWLVERRRSRLQAFLRHITYVLPQLRQAATRQELVTLLPFFKESENPLGPGSTLHPSSNN